MNKKAAGIIFSNIHDSSIPEFTGIRTMAAVPFGGRYRLIDFALSNAVNSDITRIGIITHYNYQSLMDHIGTGKDWDLARRNGGIKILPPFITAYENTVAGRLYNTRLEALIGAMNFIGHCSEEYIVLQDSDAILNIDLRRVLKQHEQTAADITIVTAKVSPDKCPAGTNTYMVQMGENNRIADVKGVSDADRANESIEISTNIFVFKRTYLLSLLNDAMAHGYTYFYRDVLRNNIDRARIMAYRYEGYYARVASLSTYYSESMRLLEPENRKALFKEGNRNVYTKIRNTAPSSYRPGSIIKNSLVADGCVIEGVVENCILFRGVKIGKGSVVRNSIILQDSVIGDNTTINCVVTDKVVTIRDGRNLSGDPSLPFFIPKGAMV